KRGSTVSVSIYNALGRRVDLLTPGYLGAGVHVIEYQPSGLPSGVYLYKLRAGEFSAVRRMLLLK
ncbi:MAG: T9SS type A sorting domain-containing protein, partial [Candidatus Zixiibacteriota bacterium]